MEHRHLDYPPGTPVDELGAAALDDLLDRGDFSDWAPLVRAIAADPHGRLASTVVALCESHPMYGTSELWRTWIGRLRAQSLQRPPQGASLAALRRRRGLTQAVIAARLGISQSDVSKIERRRDMRLSTLRAAVAATGGRLRLVADYPDESVDLDPPGDRR